MEPDLEIAHTYKNVYLVLFFFFFSFLSVENCQRLNFLFYFPV